MSKIVPLSSSCEYLISRAVSHRRAGRYDEAMALLTRAKETYGSTDEIEYETAQVYDAMDCVEEAARCYLRVIRLGGPNLAQALFQLAISSAQQGELDRASAYFARFAATDRKGVREEYADLLAHQLREHAERPAPATRKQRARALERRASERLQEGKAAAAARTMRHALRLHESGQGYTLLACCCLVMGRAEEAVRHAQRGHRMARRSVQTLCILADAYACAGNRAQTRRAVTLAAMRAADTDDLFSASIEAAKHGMDELVLLLTRRVLRREPFHTKAMMIRSAALIRQGREREANRLCARLCGLLPENTVCEAYFRATRDGLMLQAPPALGLDVTRDEADRRLTLLITAMNEEEVLILSDTQRLRMLCRIAAWAMRSMHSGQHGALMAVLLMNSLDDMQAREVLLDALMDPQLTDSLKMAILQIMTAGGGAMPHEADLGGKLVRLAAGASAQGVRTTKTGQSVVQAAADRLMKRFPDAPSVMLPMWIAYLDVYGEPKKRERPSCAAALELLYHEAAGHDASIEKIACQSGVSARTCRYYAGRIKRAIEIKNGRIAADSHREHEDRP